MQYELMIFMQSYAIHMGNDGSKRAKDHEAFTAKWLGFLLLPPWLPWDKARLRHSLVAARMEPLPWNVWTLTPW